MCGIIAGISNINIVPMLMNGLEKLEYRGYDSAGIAVQIKEDISCFKTTGNVSELKKIIPLNIESCTGIAHTRWASHGVPNLSNAHPHCTENVAVVHNGIIENYKTLKAELENLGYKFKSNTDTEVISNLLDYYFLKETTFEEAANKTVNRLRGSYALVFLFKKLSILFAASNKNSLVLGLSRNFTFIASDIIALPKEVEEIVYLEDGDRSIISLNRFDIYNSNYLPLLRQKVSRGIPEEISKKEYEHFMLKEIHEQPLALSKICDKYLSQGSVLGKSNINWSKIKTIKILGCGSAYYSGLVAKYWFEEFTDINIDLELASEYRNRKTVITEDSVTIIISQSGETLDTLEALKKAKDQNQKIISITNVEQSSIARLSDHIIPMMVGPEISVASTKAFLGQLMILLIMALEIGLKSNKINDDEFENYKSQLIGIPFIVKKILKNTNKIKNIAAEIKDDGRVMYIGRGFLYPIALEGALKMKELAYIHAEGYAGGELKHGSMSLIDDNFPVVALLPSGELFHKMFSNVQEVIARGAKILSITSEEDEDKVADNFAWNITIPKCDEIFSPLIYTIPLQLLAYYTAILKGNLVDQPRNLAKSVTVE